MKIVFPLPALTPPQGWQTLISRVKRYIPILFEVTMRRTTAWLQFVRAPNLFTVPGDPLAGFFLAGGAIGAQARPLALACCVGLLLYAAGLVLNDLADEATDAEERPGRPLPSGRIRRTSAHGALFLFATAAGISSLFCGEHTPALATALAWAVVAYNLWTKRIPVLGELNMGACRALNVLIGASAAGAAPYVPFLALGAASVFLYIVAVTMVARFEANPARSGTGIWAPLLTTGFLCALIALPTFHSGHPNRITGLAAAAAWILTVGIAYMKVKRTDQELRTSVVPSAIGVFVRGLIPLQACLVAMSGMPGSAVAAICLLALFIPATFVGRYIYGS